MLGRVVVWIAVGLAAAAGEAGATVYTWQDGEGVRHFTNALEEVPEAYRESARSFARREPDEDADDRDGGAPAARSRGGARRPLRSGRLAASARADVAYVRGIERGTRIALEQTRAVGDLARALVTELRRDPAPPPPAEVRTARTSEPDRPAFRVSIVPANRWGGRLGYGSIFPAVPCSTCCGAAAFGYGFGWGRFVPHSHFFPSFAGIRRAPLFFPFGHQLDADAFLVGRGFWVE